jgi:hypothetical protein
MVLTLCFLVLSIHFYALIDKMKFKAVNWLAMGELP